MKKIFSLALACCMVVAASAEMTRTEMRMQPKQAALSQMQKANFALKGEARKAVKDSASQADTLYYGRPKYAFNVGYDPQGYGYYPMVVVSNADSVIFVKDNYCMHTSAQFDWSVNDQALELYTDSFVFAAAGDLEDDGTYYMPKLFDENNGEYMYGASEDYQYLVANPSEKLPLTKCAMYTSTTVDADGYDIYYMDWDESGNKFMGTGMAPTFSDGAASIDTLFTYMGTPNTTSNIDTISIMVWSDVADPLPAANAGLKLAVYDFTAKKEYSYTAHTSDIAEWTAYSGTYFGLLNFPIKASIEGEYEILINGFQQTGNNIACETDYYSWNYFSGDVDPTYMEHNGHGYSYGNNIALFVNSTYGTATTAVENVANDVKIEKEIRNGQLIIRKGNKEFNVLGAQL